jgi:hypothetical protein
LVARFNITSSMCGRVPILPEKNALIVGIVSIICPGGGALVAAAMEDFAIDLILLAIAQFVLAIFFVGWIWAIIWGVRVIAAGNDNPSPQTATESSMKPAAPGHPAPPPPANTGAPTAPKQPV